MPFNFGPSDKAQGRRIVTVSAGAGTVRAVFEVSGKPRAVIHLDSQNVYLTDIDGRMLNADGTDRLGISKLPGDVVGWAPIEVWLTVPANRTGVGSVFHDREHAVSSMGQAMEGYYIGDQPIRVEVPQ